MFYLIYLMQNSKIRVIISKQNKVDDPHVLETSKTEEFIKSAQLQRLDRIFECFKVGLMFIPP